MCYYVLGFEMAEGGSFDLNFETLTNQAKWLINGLPNFEYQLREYCLSGRKRMTILLCGKTGVGKSHLTNALIGKVLAKEGEDLDPETDEVNITLYHSHKIVSQKIEENKLILFWIFRHLHAFLRYDQCTKV